MPKVRLLALGNLDPRHESELRMPPGYARHRPEETLLYELVARHYPEFVAAREAVGRPLPNYVQEEFERI